MKLQNLLVVLWIFDLSDGAKKIDPFNPLPAPVIVESVQVDRKENMDAVGIEKEPTEHSLPSVVLPPPVDLPPLVDLHTSQQTTETIKQEHCPQKEHCSSKELSTCGPLTALFKQYLRQLVNLLEPHLSPFSMTNDMCLRVSISDHDLQKFRKYTDSSDTPVHDVHEALSNMLQDAHKLHTFDFESRIYWLEEKLGISSQCFLQIALILPAFALVLHALRLLGRKQILGVVFTVSVFFTWFEMFQKEQANQEKILSEELSQRCPSLAKLSWFERMGNFLSSSFTFQDENCREFYQASIVNPVFKVNPMEVCAVVIVKVVTTPLEVLGTGIKKFLVGLLRDLPFHIQIPVLLFLLVVVVLTPMCVRGYRVRIPFLLSIEPAPREVHHIGQDVPDGATGFSKTGALNKATVQEGRDGLDNLPAHMAALSIEDNTDQISKAVLDVNNPVPDVISPVSDVISPVSDVISPVSDVISPASNVMSSVSDVNNLLLSEVSNIPQTLETETHIPSNREASADGLEMQLNSHSAGKSISAENQPTNQNDGISRKPETDVSSSMIGSDDQYTLQQIPSKDFAADCSAVIDKVYVKRNDAINPKSQDQCSLENEISSSTELPSAAENCCEIKNLGKEAHLLLSSNSNECDSQKDNFPQNSNPSNFSEKDHLAQGDCISKEEDH